MTDTLQSPTEGGYRMRPEEVWAEARDAYRNGFTAAEVCERYDLGVSAFWKRARTEKWRRADMDYEFADSGFTDETLIDLDAPVASRDELADIAWAQATSALKRGRSTEAQRLLRIHADLKRPERTPPAPPTPDPIIDPTPRAEPPKVHKVQSNFDTALSDLEEAVLAPLNRADRRRLARELRIKGPP